MKFKMARSLLVLSLALLLVIGGTTVAWFTAELNIPSAAEMIMGNLDFEITDATVYSFDDGNLEGMAGETIDWDAGENKEFRWTFENTGTKASFFRARPDYELTFSEPGGCHFGGGGYGGGCGCGPGKCPEEGETVCEGCITWNLPEGSDWAEGHTPGGKPDGWYYYCQPVAKGEEVALGLKGHLNEDAGNGTCNVELVAEAVQATHGATDAEWPGNPCSSKLESN